MTHGKTITKVCAPCSRDLAIAVSGSRADGRCDNCGRLDRAYPVMFTREWIDERHKFYEQPGKRGRE